MGILRILFAIYVVLYHCGQFSSIRFMQGPEAVQSFYIISGFYMALILNEKYCKSHNHYKLFISNRFLRLYPTYWIVAGLVIITSLVFILFSGGNNWGMLSNYKVYGNSLNWLSLSLLSISNVVIFGQDISMFTALNGHGGLFFTPDYALHANPKLYMFMLVPQAWTISMELMFYLIAPFIARRSLLIIFSFFVFSALVKLLLLRNGLTNDPWTYRFFPAELMYFSMGLLSYKLYEFIKVRKISKPILLLFYLGTLFVILGYEYFHYYIRNYLYFAGLALAIPFIFSYTKKLDWDRSIGELSYPVYIAHIFFRNLLYNLGVNEANTSLWVLLLVIPFSIFLNNVVLRKIESYRQQRIAL